MLYNGRIFSQQDLYIVKNLDKPLLGGPAIKALRILGKINAINNESHRYKKDFLRVFKGPGKLRKTYTKYTWMRQPNRFLLPPAEDYHSL